MSINPAELQSARAKRIVEVLRVFFVALLAFTIINSIAAMYKQNVFIPFSLCVPPELFSASVNIPDNKVLSVTLMMIAGIVLFAFIALFYFARSSWRAYVVAAILAVIDCTCVISWQIYIDDLRLAGLKAFSAAMGLTLFILLMIFHLRLHE